MISYDAEYKMARSQLARRLAGNQIEHLRDFQAFDQLGLSRFRSNSPKSVFSPPVHLANSLKSSGGLDKSAPKGVFCTQVQTLKPVTRISRREPWFSKRAAGAGMAAEASLLNGPWRAD